MKSSARIDSLVFQLTPTRTRCDLVIIANGKSEKIASGLLSPFLSHLKSAQEQNGKGGYSIILEPGRDTNAAWFTKGTVERFVRFVSTPEILERVYTIECEIAQTEEAITFLRNNDTALPAQVQEQHSKDEESNEGHKSALAANEEKAIVLYKPDGLHPETDGSSVEDGNSRIQLLKVLETRKNVLQKEQGMAFARAVVAGFDIDHIAPLVSFSECFGALRMMDACSRFVELWKAKHESGQWLEMESAEAISSPADFASPNASGIIMTPNLIDKQKELWSQSELGSGNNGSPSIATNGDGTVQHGPPHFQEQYPGQFPHPLYPSWPNYPQAGQLPMFQAYPVPVPYYQNYAGNGPYFQPAYPSVDDPKLHSGLGTRQRRHSMDSRDPKSESEAQALDLDAQIRAESDGSRTDEDSKSRELRKKSRKSGQKQSRMVVIRNINYISPQKQDSSGSDSHSTASEDDEGGLDTDTNIRKRNSPRKFKREGNQRNSMDLSRICEKEDMVPKHGDEGHWQAFQSLLLKDSDEDDKSARRDMFGMEGKVRGRKSHNSAVDDPSVGGRQYLSKDGQPISKDDVVGDMSRRIKPSNDRMLHSGQSISSSDDQRHIQFAEMRGRRLPYRANGEDPTIPGGNYLSNQPNSFSDPLIGGEFGTINDQNRSSSHGIRDESFIVPSRLGQVGVDVRAAIAMDSEIPHGELNDNIRGQDNYEPHDLNLVPRRVIEDGMPGFDPALDYQLQAAKVNSDKKIGNFKQGPKNGDKSQGLKSEKKVATMTKRGKPAKLSPSEEARARAEKLRSFKADLQKLKKDKEEEQRKRIEALKMERQKRIAARTGGSSAQTKRPLPTKLSPSSRKGSKFSDSDPGSSSPLQRSTVKTIPKLSASSHKTSGPSGNRLIKSTTSLVEKRVGKTGPSNSKLSMARIRRLSEPKERSTVASSVKSRSAESLFRRAVPNEPAVKKSFPIVNLEKSKFSTLPDQKARVSKGQSVLEVVQNNTSTKERTPKMAGTDLSNASTSFTQKGNPKVPSQIDNDDNIVVEKTVVVLEHESPSFPAARDSEGIRDIQSVKFKAYPPKVKEEESMSDNVQASCEVKEIKIDPPCNQSSKQPNSTEAGAAHAGEMLKVSDKKISQSPYHAPYARMSSLEDPCTGKSEYTKAPPRNLGMETSDIVTAHVSDTGREPKLDKIWEISEKAVEKGSPKGLKRLLKFGKKKQSSVSGDTALDSEQATHGSDLGTHDDVTNVGSSGEAFTLKSLISQDEAIREQNSPHKSSRTFSLLSPFRSKSSEKKTST